MTRISLVLLALLSACSAADPGLGSSVAAAEGAPLAAVGQPAPGFSLPDLNGKQVSLGDFAGKTVVLEWFNPGCPFVEYAHGEGPLKDLAAQWTAKGVVWLSINSSAPGKQGAGLENNRAAAAKWNIQNPILLDEEGKVGRAYGAKTTPHMYVVGPAGKLAYMGALDNAPLGKVDGGGARQDLVGAALGELLSGKPVTQASTQSYGCGVKYQ